MLQYINAEKYFLKAYKIPPKSVVVGHHPQVSLTLPITQMSHIQSSPYPALPVVDEVKDSLSRLSTRESTYSAVTLIKPNNQGRQLL